MTLEQALAWSEASHTERWRLAARRANAESLDHGTVYTTMDAEALETLAEAVRAQQQRMCNTCIWQRPPADGRPTLCGKVSIPGHTVAVVGCAQLGNTCGSWEPR